MLFQLGVDKFPKNKEEYYVKLMQLYRERRISSQICDEYERRAKECSVEARYKLQRELMEDYHVTEIEAVNILNGYHTGDYIRNYELMSQGIFPNVTGPNSRKDY